MLCAVYKTKVKEGMYLYVPGKGQFDDVPEALMKQFKQPELVMLIAMDKRPTLAGVDKTTLVSALNEKGFYLQMPPKQEDLLASHRKTLGLPATPEKSVGDKL